MHRQLKVPAWCGGWELTAGLRRPRAPAAANPSAATRAELSSAAHSPPGRVGKACRPPGTPDGELLLRAAEARQGAGAAQTSASAWCCWGGRPAPSQPVPSAVQARRRRERGRQVCPARRHRARRSPRGRSSSCSGARA